MRMQARWEGGRLAGDAVPVDTRVHEPLEGRDARVLGLEVRADLGLPVEADWIAHRRLADDAGRGDARRDFGYDRGRRRAVDDYGHDVAQAPVDAEALVRDVTGGDFQRVDGCALLGQNLLAGLLELSRLIGVPLVLDHFPPQAPLSGLG